MGLAKGLGKRIPDCHGAAAPSRTPLARSRTTRANTALFHHRAGYTPSRNKEKKKNRYVGKVGETRKFSRVKEL